MTTGGTGGTMIGGTTTGGTTTGGVVRGERIPDAGAAVTNTGPSMRVSSGPVDPAEHRRPVLEHSAMRSRRPAMHPRHRGR